MMSPSAQTNTYIEVDIDSQSAAAGSEVQRELQGSAAAAPVLAADCDGQR
jgi:hypothetical protein